jgi:hypothetical protein
MFLNAGDEVEKSKTKYKRRKNLDSLIWMCRMLILMKN